MVSKEFNRNSYSGCGATIATTSALNRRMAIVPRDNNINEKKMKIVDSIVDNLLSRKRGPLSYTMFPTTKEALSAAAVSHTSKTGNNLYNFSAMSATSKKERRNKTIRRYPRHNTYPLPPTNAVTDRYDNDTYPSPSKVATRVATRKRSSYRQYKKINDSLRNVLVNMSSDFVVFDEEEKDSMSFFLENYDNDKEEEERCFNVRQRYSANTLRYKITKQYQRKQQQKQAKKKYQLIPKE